MPVEVSRWLGRAWGLAQLMLGLLLLAQFSHWRSPLSASWLVLISPVLEPELVGSPRFAQSLRRPPLILEGDRDIQVTSAEVEPGVAAMRGAGLKPGYVLLPGHDHFLMFSARSAVFQWLDRLPL